MRAGQRRAHLVAWMVLGPLAILAIAWSVLSRAPAPRPSPASEPPGGPGTEAPVP